MSRSEVDGHLTIVGARPLRSVNGRYEFGPPSVIRCDGGAITSIDVLDDATAASVPASPNTVDASGMFAIPGLVNCHTHAAMTMLRGVVEDVPPHSWFNDYIWPMEVNLTPHDVYLGTMLAAAEMISSGVTAFVDHYFYMDEVVRAVDETGLRANLGSTFFSSQGAAGLEQSVEFAERRNGAASGRITTSLAPHATYTCDDADLVLAAQHATRLGVPVHIHAAETIGQTETSLERHGVTPIEVLRRTGVLDASAIIAHGNGIVDSDIELLTGHEVGVAHCPKGYLKAGLDTLTPIRALRDAGVAVGLGTDGAASQNSLDVLDNARMTALSQKLTTADATWLDLNTAIDIATAGSARTAHVGDVGRLEPGAAADLAIIDLGGPHCQPIHDPIATLLYSAIASDVRHTVVAGRALMINRRLQTIELEPLLSEIAERAVALTDLSHGSSIQVYDT